MYVELSLKSIELFRYYLCGWGSTAQIDLSFVQRCDWLAVGLFVPAKSRSVRAGHDTNLALSRHLDESCSCLRPVSAKICQFGRELLFLLGN